MKRILAGALFALFYISGCKSNENVDLVPPPDGEGFHFETGFTEVPYGEEEQDCYFFKVPDNGSPVYVNHIIVEQNPGSHHMNIFRVKTITGLDPANGDIQTAKDGVGDCFVSSNWADWPLVINSQTEGDVDWTLPDGVAHRFEPGETLMLQTHYVNATSQKTPGVGHVEVNFYSMTPESVTAEVGTLFATKQSIRICQSNPEPSFSGTCQFNGTSPVHVIGANAHFHSRGKQFDIFKWDGTSSENPPDSDRFYRSTNWDDPPMARYPDLDFEVQAGGGVWYTCSYEWKAPPDAIGGCDGVNAYDAAHKGTAPEDLDCCYVFGGQVEYAEHCNVFVYYYPKIDDINCF